VRAVEDPKLIEYLHRSRLPLEVCPTSNICLGVFPSLAEHCLPRLLDLGLRVSINSDDPPMFNTSLTREYLACTRTCGWDRATVQELAESAVDMSLLPASEKQRLRKRFQVGFAATE
jgi:adenosine deaminase